MDKNHHIWQHWAQKLQHWGVSELVASILETSGPLSVLCTQSIYIIHPLVNGFVAWRTLDQLAELLDDETEKQYFIAYLREGVAQ
jgi:hypothetical protein